MTRPGPSEAVLAQSYEQQEELEDRIAELEAALEGLIKWTEAYFDEHPNITKAGREIFCPELTRAKQALTEPVDGTR